MSKKDMSVKEDVANEVEPYMHGNWAVRCLLECNCKEISLLLELATDFVCFNSGAPGFTRNVEAKVKTAQVHALLEWKIEIQCGKH